jgi:hypothetical protein
MNKMHIFIYLDSAGWEILRKHDFLPDVLHFRCQVRSQLGDSVTSLSTALTGQPLNIHKHFGDYYYSPRRSLREMLEIMMHYLPCEKGFQGKTAPLSGLFRMFRGYSGCFDCLHISPGRLRFFDYAGGQDIFAKDGIAPAKSIPDYLHENNIPYMISDWRKSEEENLKDMLERVRRRNVQFCLLFMSGLDKILHHTPADEQKIAESLKHYEKQIKNIIFEVEAYYNKFSISVMSGHGMTARQAVINIKNKIGKLGLGFGKDYIAFYDPTMARFWYLDQEAKSIIVERLRNIPHTHILSEEEMIRYNINFADNMYGETVLLLDPGYQIEPNDHIRHSYPGMHGYAPEHEDSYGIFMSNHQPSPPPLWVGDFYHIMLAAINDCIPEHFHKTA